MLTDEVLAAHIDALLPEKLRRFYGDMLPEGVAPTKDEIMKVFSSSFFRSANEELSNTINRSSVGEVLARTFGYVYTGEGIEAFLNGLRQVKKEEDGE